MIAALARGFLAEALGPRYHRQAPTTSSAIRAHSWPTLAVEARTGVKTLTTSRRGVTANSAQLLRFMVGLCELAPARGLQHFRVDSREL